MRCPSCAAETPDGSRFCGICGRRIEEHSPAQAHPDTRAVGRPAVASGHGPGPGQGQSSMSLIELPVSRGARWARIIAVLAVDAALAGAGVALLLAYLQERERQAPPAADAGVAEVQVLTPSRAPGASGPATAPPQADDAVAGGAAEPGALDRGGAAVEVMTREIAALVQRNTLPLQGCYQQAAKTSPPDRPLEGRVDIRLAITETGRASQVHAISNTTESDTLARCVTGLFESWTFPPPPGGEPLELVWPLRFKAPK